MEKNIEVELRAIIKDAELFRNQLKDKGAEYKNSSYLCDIYFCEKSAASVADVEMNEIGSYSLRLRIARKNDVETITLNTKTITNTGDHNAWEEHEITVDSFKEAALILSVTEFKPFFKLEKHRHAYVINEMEVLVEDIIDFGGAIEVEIMCVSGDEEESKSKIKSLLLNQLGLSESDIVPKSVTNIIMKQRSFNQEITF